jgi:hypothetical protein
MIPGSLFFVRARLAQDHVDALVLGVDEGVARARLAGVGLLEQCR